jgi:membrane protease subunit HflC
MQAKVRLSAMITSSLRGILGQTKFETMLSEQRHEIMDRVQKDVAKSVESMGIEIVDVRIRRVDLPEQNSQAVFKRMESERERIAKKKRALGRQKAEEIRANADREKAVILANAEKESKILRGEGEAKAAKIYADAYSKDKGFFEFYRSLQAYEKSLKSENTSYILSPDSGDFLNTFRNSK